MGNSFRVSGEIYIKVKVRPNAEENKIRQILKDEDGDIIKIDIAAPAVGGKANRELIKFLAEAFNLTKNDIRIISGAGDRLKLIKLVKNL